MIIGIVCFPTYGGSSAVATELGVALARRGHHVHFIGYDLPFRLDLDTPNVFFHRVEVIPYPVFRFPPYTLALASHLADIVTRFDIEIIHLHYAIPHATAAFLARQIMPKQHQPKVITTLHGTDIQLASLDPAYREITNFSLNQSDAVTAVSHYLKEKTESEFNLNKPVEVIHNFINPQKYAKLSSVYNEGCTEKIITHISNFRPLKRIDLVLEVFSRIACQIPSKLWLIGDGPEIDSARLLARKLGVADHVEFMGKRRDIVPLLSLSDLLLLPSSSESFGLVALEAIACEVVVLASRVGGLPEVITDGCGGYLFELEDVRGMTARALTLLRDPQLYERVCCAGTKMVRENFLIGKSVRAYESLYQSLLAKDDPPVGK